MKSISNAASIGGSGGSKGKSFYGTCNTAGDVSAKVVTITDTDWELKEGTIIGIKFTNSNTASNVTLNTNDSGAKSIYYNNAAYTGTSSDVTGSASRVNYYMYDGSTYWVWLNTSRIINNTVQQAPDDSTNSNFEVLFSKTADNTDRTEGAKKSSELTFNPSTGNLQTIQINGVTVGNNPQFTDTTYDVVSTAANGLAPQITDTTKYLKGDGTWAIPSASDIGLGNVGNFKAVSTVANQGLTSTEQSNARANIGAGTSSFDGAYSSLSGTPTLGTAAALDVATTGDASITQVVKGNDSRLSDARNAADVYSWAKAATKPSYTASEVGAIATTAKGANNGVAELDSTGKVPSSQLPSFVDDVLEYNSNSDFPATGESGKIYIAKDTNKTYRWSGSSYTEISESLALGETSSTAYRGDRGKTAYDHSQSTHARTDATAVAASSTNGNITINGTETTVYTHPGSGTNPHGTTKSDVGLGNVGNFKAVSTVASQGLTDTEKSNARANIGAGTSSLTIGDTATTAAAGNHTHSISIATDSGTNQLSMASSTKYKITAGGSSYIFTTPGDSNNRKSFYGTCTTDAATAAKVVTLSDTTGWELKAGTIVGVKFTNTNSASNVTLDVNSTGAKSIYYNNAAYTGSTPDVCGYTNRINYYMYDGSTYWVWLNTGAIINTRVTQTADDSTNSNFEVIFSTTADNTTRTEAAKKSSKLTFNPSTGNMTVTKVNGYVPDKIIKLTGQTVTFSGTTASISNSSVTTNSLIDVYFDDASLSAAQTAKIVVDSAAEAINFTAEETPSSSLVCDIIIRN